MMAQERLRGERVFGCHNVSPAKNGKCADSDVVGMSDGNSDKKERACRFLCLLTISFRRRTLLTLFSSHRYNFLLIPQDTIHCPS